MVQIARSSGSVPASSDDIPACDSRSQIVKPKWFILPVLLSEPHQTVAESILVFVFCFFAVVVREYETGLVQVLRPFDLSLPKRGRKLPQSWTGSMKPQ